MMSELLSRRDHRLDASALLPSLKRSPLHRLKSCLVVLIRLVIVLAFGGGALLLFNDIYWPIHQLFLHAPVSAIPLLLIGLAYLGFQVVIRAKLLDLLEALIVSAAFLLWGVDQLLSAGWETTTIGDVVIVLFVIDLGWMMTNRLKQQSSSTTSHEDSHNVPVASAQGFHLPPLPSMRMLQSLPLSDLSLPRQEKQHSASSIPGQPPRVSPSPHLKRNRLVPLHDEEPVARESRSS